MLSYANADRDNSTFRSSLYLPLTAEEHIFSFKFTLCSPRRMAALGGGSLSPLTDLPINQGKKLYNRVIQKMHSP